MSTVWNEGYFTDVAYTYGYYREINPVFQRFCLLLRGFAAPDTAQQQHCKLGFGQGVSINIHAAASPDSFVGTDFNPAHAAHANQLAAISGSGARSTPGGSSRRRVSASSRRARRWSRPTITWPN